MKSVFTLSVAFFVLCHAGSARTDTAQDMTLRPETPVVDVSPRPDGRQFIDLPALEYTFAIEARCDDEWIPESLSLNVADSRITFGTGQLSDSPPREIVLNIPPQQLAPVAVQDFCLLPEEAATPRDEVPDRALPAPSLLTIRAVLSAQASLLCVSDEQRRITYVSQPLDVTLTCKPPASGETGD